MIPNYIKGYLCTLGLQYIRNDLLDKGIGAFAVYPLYSAATDPQGKERTMGWALMHAAGNEELAKAMLRVPDDHCFGLAFVKHDGEIAHLKVDSRVLRNVARNFDEFVRDVQSHGFAIDPAKICDPHAMYRVGH